MKPTLAPPGIWATQLSPSLIATLNPVALHDSEPPAGTEPGTEPEHVTEEAVYPLHETVTLPTDTCVLPMFLSVKTTVLPSV